MKPKNVLRPPDPNEAAVQAAIVDGLRFLGYTVLVTSRRRSRGPDGADPGVPDLLVTRGRWGEGGSLSADAWGTGCFLGLEVKGPRTRLSREQADLQLMGRIVVVRSFDEARAAVENFERNLGKGRER